MSAAERNAQNDITDYYLKGRECDKLRAVNKMDATDEALKWQAIDAVLCPELYRSELRVQEGLQSGFSLADLSGGGSERSGEGGAGTAVEPMSPSAPASEPMSPLSVTSEGDETKGDEGDENGEDNGGLGTTNNAKKSGSDTNNPFDEAFEYDREQLMELYIHPAGQITSPLDKEVRSLLDKYYVPLELAALGRERRATTLDVVEEVTILAESLRLGEQHFERQLREDPLKEVEEPPWLLEGISLKTLDFIALRLGVGIEKRNLMHKYEQRKSQLHGSGGGELDDFDDFDGGGGGGGDGGFSESSSD